MRLKIFTVGTISFILLIFGLLFSFNNFSNAQTKTETDDWYKKLYEKNIVYEDFACEVKDKNAVKEFFNNRPLKQIIPVCHNDCPIVKCRPVIPFPTMAKAVKVSGTASVHILVNEERRTIYTRVLAGHPLIKESVRKAACETQFREHERKHQGVMHFLIDSSDEINVPSRANIVSQ